MFFSRRANFGIFWLVALLFLLSTVALAKPHPGVTYVKIKAAGVPVHLVDVDLGRGDLVVRPVVVSTGRREQFSQLVAKTRPVAAVNGTFFDTTTGITVGNLVSEGRLLSEGMVGSSLVCYEDGTFGLLSSSRNLGRYKDWSRVKFAVGGGLTLISSGDYYVNPSSEGFSDPSLFQPRPRTALGVTREGRLRMVVATQSVTLWQMAHVMKELHCFHAVNLDGGSSVGLSAGGTTMVSPSRKLTNIVGIYPAHNPPRLDRAVQVAQLRALAHYNKGRELLEAGDLRVARSHMRQAVAKDPHQAGYWRAVGQAEYKFGNNRRAVEDLHQAVSLYFKRGDLLAARQVAGEILEIDKDDAAAHLAFGECQLKLGFRQQARIHLEYVLNAHPGHPRATELAQHLKSLQEQNRQSSTSMVQLKDILQTVFAIGFNGFL